MSIPNSNTILGNSQLVSYSTKYNLFNQIIFGVDKVKVVNYDELIKSTHVVNCVGTSPNEESVYKIFLPDIGVSYIRLVRQYYQLQKIPIGLLTNTFNFRLIGNSSVEIYVKGELIRKFSNPFYQIQTCGTVPDDLRIEYSLYLFYNESDEIEFSQSPYYLEPLIVPNNNCC